MACWGKTHSVSATLFDKLIYLRVAEKDYIWSTVSQRDNGVSVDCRYPGPPIDLLNIVIYGQHEQGHQAVVHNRQPLCEGGLCRAA